MVKVKALSAETILVVSKFIQEALFEKHGCPELLVLDQGPPYKGPEVRDLVAKQKIQHIYTAAYHLETNGLAECTIGTW